MKDKTILIIGASHAGTTFAFALRREGWQGTIIMLDKDIHLPYHRPPLSKTFLTSDADINQHLLMSHESYIKNEIDLRLGIGVIGIDKLEKSITLTDGLSLSYDKLVLATGARPLIPPIDGIDEVNRIFYLRTASDAIKIRNECQAIDAPRVAIIGGGYIGLECAASLHQLGATVTILERDSRLLSRVTAPEMSDFFLKLHTDRGVNIELNKNVVLIEGSNNIATHTCEDGSRFIADMIIIGVGVSPNTDMAHKADLAIDNGILVNNKTQTSDQHIYAIGDCTQHHNSHYGRSIRLESVQNAVDQAKIAAKNICKKEAFYDSVPWFWSDQYDIKLQIVGLSLGYTEVLIRIENQDKTSFSIWYFREEELLAVDAVNCPKAYVLASKFIKKRLRVNKPNLMNIDMPLKPVDLILKPSERD